MQRLKHILIVWFPLAILITLLSGLMYSVVQQVLRKYANDPQIQMAEDAADALTNGQSLATVVPAGQINIAKSLAPYLVVFDDSGKVLASSGLLHNQLPTFPAGVFEYVRLHGEDRVTWQPEPGVRSATVVVHNGGSSPGFVMAGRSLRESENRDTEFLFMIGFGWAFTCFATLVGVALSEFIFKR